MSTTTSATRSHATWDIDVAHSSLGFTVRHLLISKVHGRFDRWSASLTFDESRPERSQVSVRVEAASIDTHEPDRDTHLRSPDFFDTEKYPNITFRSTSVERTEAEHYQVAGDLAISGVSRRVVLEVEALGRANDPWGGERMGFTGKTTIDRRDFGLVWNQTLEAGGVVVGEHVEISIEIEAVRRVEGAAKRTA